MGNFTMHFLPDVNAAGGILLGLGKIYLRLLVLLIIGFPLRLLSRIKIMVLFGT